MLISCVFTSSEHNMQSNYPQGWDTGRGNLCASGYRHDTPLSRFGLATPSQPRHSYSTRSGGYPGSDVRVRTLSYRSRQVWRLSCQKAVAMQCGHREHQEWHSFALPASTADWQGVQRQFHWQGYAHRTSHSSNSKQRKNVHKKHPD